MCKNEECHSCTISNNVISVDEEMLCSVLDFIGDRLPVEKRPIVQSIALGKSAWVVFDRNIPEEWDEEIRKVAGA